MARVDAVELSAGAFGVLTFHMTDQIRLRRLAIVSNLLFLLHGRTLGLWPVALFHAILLPLTLVRLSQATMGLRVERRPGMSSWPANRSAAICAIARPSDGNALQSKVPATRPSSMKARAVRVLVRATTSASSALRSNAMKVRSNWRRK